MRKTAIIILLFSICFACRDEDGAPCNTENPIEELTWLKDNIEEKESQPHPGIGYYFYQGRYDKKDVFIADICCPACDYVILVYDCEGNTLNISADKVTDKKLVWESDESPCERS
jgi:hypothetical protein